LVRWAFWISFYYCGCDKCRRRLIEGGDQVFGGPGSRESLTTCCMVATSSAVLCIVVAAAMAAIRGCG
jgi:hypothetical protein